MSNFPTILTYVICSLLFLASCGGTKNREKKDELVSVPRKVKKELCELENYFIIVFERAQNRRELSRKSFDVLNGTEVFSGVKIIPRVQTVSAKGFPADITLSVKTSLDRAFEFRDTRNNRTTKQIQFKANNLEEIKAEFKKWKPIPLGIPKQVPNGKSQPEEIIATISLKNKDEECSDTHSALINWVRKMGNTVGVPLRRRGSGFTLEVSSAIIPIEIPPTTPSPNPRPDKVYTFPMGLYWKVKDPFNCPCVPNQKYKVVQFASGEVSIRGEKPYRTPYHIDTKAEQQELANQGKNYDPSFTLDPFDQDPNDNTDHIRPVLCPQGKKAVGQFDAPGVPESLYNQLVGKGGYVIQTFRAFLICHNPAAYSPGANTTTAAEFLKMGVVAEMNYQIKYVFSQLNPTPKVNVQKVSVRKNGRTKNLSFYKKHNCKKVKLGDLVKGAFKDGYERPVTKLRQDP